MATMAELTTEMEKDPTITPTTGLQEPRYSQIITAIIGVNAADMDAMFVMARTDWSKPTLSLLHIRR